MPSSSPPTLGDHPLRAVKASDIREFTVAAQERLAAKTVHELQLGCACGAELMGGVPAHRMKVAAALFVAHHHGPQCAPR